MAREHIIISTLAKMVQYGTYYSAHCKNCGRNAELDMADLIRRPGPDYPAAGQNLGGRLRCERCGHRGAYVLVGSEAARRPVGTYADYGNMRPTTDGKRDGAR